ncbi:MAG: Maf family protein [Elusimicrobiaceae bacterium]|nr:Maf family protein [Elusimicrobiaceae bacterium]
MEKLILASQSPRRRDLLAQARIPFETVAPDVPEDTVLTRPSAIVKELALRKALAIAGRYPGRTVLGADTIVYCKGRILGKPADEADALELLRLENDSWQTVYTGVALVLKNQNVKLCGYEISRCRARRLTEPQLRELAAKHLDKAGGYAVQDNDDTLIKKIVGPFDNVVGLPVGLVREMLHKAGLVA